MPEWSGPDEVIAQLVGAWVESPALAVDRHLDVSAANTRATVDLGLRTGANLAWSVYLGPGGVHDGPRDRVLRQGVTGALREALERHGSDARFESTLGELLALSPSFAEDWSQWPDPVPFGQLTCAGRGTRKLDFFVFDAAGAAETRLVVLRAPAG